MKHLRAIMWVACLALVPLSCGCDDRILQNAIAGLQEGAVVTATGIINAFFDERFDHEASADDEEEGGNDLFGQL